MSAWEGSQWQAAKEREARETPSAAPVVPKPRENTLTVGIRSDGNVCILSDPNMPGKVEAQNLIMPKGTARWLAQELLRMTEEQPGKGNEK